MRISLYKDKNVTALCCHTSNTETGSRALKDGNRIVQGPGALDTPKCKGS